MSSHVLLLCIRVRSVEVGDQYGCKRPVRVNQLRSRSLSLDLKQWPEAVLL